MCQAWRNEKNDSNIPQVNDDLQYIFNQIYTNNIPPPIKHFFSDVYLFCLHKDPSDTSKLRPLGIPTAMRRIIARHVAQYFKPKFSWECRRHVADMSARHSDVGGLRQKRHVAATQDMKKKPRHTQFMSITDDKFKSAQTYELATLP